MLKIIYVGIISILILSCGIYSLDENNSLRANDILDVEVKMNSSDY